MTNDKTGIIESICESTLKYLRRNQDLKAGEYYGAIWSEKAYHGPLLDYHAGGSHHHRGAGSAGLVFWRSGRRKRDRDLMHRAEWVFDWLAARQRAGGGYQEIQNNEKPSDWEGTGLEECSTIETAFVAHGLGHALLEGLPPKKSYADCLQRIGHWLLSIERPAGSGMFPHHDRSPYDCLNANLHAAESLILAYWALKKVYGRTISIFFAGAKRAVLHTLALQWRNGCFPYLSSGGVTINYTSLVMWCLNNLWSVLPPDLRPALAAPAMIGKAGQKASAFLRSCVGPGGKLLWDKNETSSAKFNVWTYAITFAALMSIGGRDNLAAAEKLLHRLAALRTKSGLLPMRDRGGEITECAFMQADIMLFLQSGSGSAK